MGYIWIVLAIVVIYLLIRTHLARQQFNSLQKEEAQLELKVEQATKLAESTEAEYEKAKQKFSDFTMRTRAGRVDSSSADDKH